MLIPALLTSVSHNSHRHSVLISHSYNHPLTMSSTQAELLTGEQAKELILTLAGRLAAAMEAPAAEWAKAEEKMMDTLVSDPARDW